MANCKEFAPFQKILVEGARWSSDDQQFDLIACEWDRDKQGNIIQILQSINVLLTPEKFNTFPGATFTLENYDKNADIQNFGFDGLSSIHLK